MVCQLSIIIVNYNVRAFLEQCIYSVQKATEKVSAEIIVIDNNSVDDSIEMLQTNFQHVKLIANSENKGFAFACNQGIKMAAGDYILLLNPDTIVNNDSFELCIDFMDKNPQAGALGVKMIDGTGKFLPESKRSLPTASSAFYKIFGLSALFPHSKRFGKYQLKYLDENQIHEVEVLSGAFMFIRKSVLSEIGLLDEHFFMYGEDIDLSYRIIKAGYKNYYFPKTTIIHYKGESTKKASIRYVKMFYNAMLVFSDKHYRGKNKAIFRFIIRIAIYFRASISIVKRFLGQVYLPFFDFLLIYLAYIQIVPLWEQFKFGESQVYSLTLLNYYIPGYILIWLLLIAIFKGFDLNQKFWKLLKAIFIGTIAILTIYSLLPEDYRFSRALILIGASISLCVCTLNRFIAKNLFRRTKTGLAKKQATLLIKDENSPEIENYPESLNSNFEIRKIINLGNNCDNVLNLSKINEIINIYKIEAIIFFIRDMSPDDVIKTIIHTQNRKLEYKMILPLNSTLIGPQSVVNLNTVPAFKINPISTFANRLKKRVLDVTLAVLIFILSPLFWLRNNPKHLYSTLFMILINKLSWVSYQKSDDINYKGLPKLKDGVFNPLIISEMEPISQEQIYESNKAYASNYSISSDLFIIFRALKNRLNLNK